MRILLISVLISTFSINLHAQLGRVLRSVDEVEVLGGPSLVSMRGVLFKEHNKPKIGHSIGIGLTWKANEKAFISAKFLYERKGLRRYFNEIHYTDENNERQIGESEYVLKTSYLTIPLCFKYSLNKTGNLFIEVGPYFSYLVKAQSYTWYSWRGTRIMNQKENLRDYDFGVAFTVNKKIFIWDTISVNSFAGIHYGFTDVSKFSPSTTINTLRNNVLTAGLSLSIKK